MTSRSIWLVRHASTDWTGVRWAGVTDLALNAAGRTEAAALAARLGPTPHGPTFVSSPALRARQTAAILAEPFRATTDTDGELREVDVGAVDGLIWDEAAAAFPELAEAVAAGRTHLDWPGGERATDVEARAGRAWQSLAARRGTGDLVVVTHGGLIAALLRVALGPGAQLPPWAGPATAIRLINDDGTWRIAS